MNNSSRSHSQHTSVYGMCMCVCVCPCISMCESLLFVVIVPLHVDADHIYNSFHDYTHNSHQLCSPIVLLLLIVFVLEHESIDCTRTRTQIGQDNCSWSHQHRHHLVTVTVRAWWIIVMTTMTWWMTMKVMNQGQQLQPMSWQYHRAETFDPTLWNSDHSHDTQQKRERGYTHTRTHTQLVAPQNVWMHWGWHKMLRQSWLDSIFCHTYVRMHAMTNRNPYHTYVNRSELTRRTTSTHMVALPAIHLSEILMNRAPANTAVTYRVHPSPWARSSKHIVGASTMVLCAGLAHTMHEQ